MAHPYPLAAVWSLGMRRDVDRASLPGGSAWNLVDFIPDELGAPLSGCGGWTYAGSATSGSTSFKAVFYAPFTAGGVVLGIDQQPHLFNAVTGVNIGSTIVPGGPLAYHRGKVIIPNSDGTTAVQFYDGSTLGTLAGTPPTGQLTATYKDHLIIGKTNGNKNRFFFSAAGDPTNWNPDGSGINVDNYVDSTGDLVAIFPLLNAVLLFHQDTVERLRGTIPPPNGDMVLEPLFDYGCIDPFSVVGWRNRVIFASATGIYMTDGATDADLTAGAQLKTYWQSLISGYTSSWRIAAGIYRDHYIVSINNGSTLVDCLCFNLLGNNSPAWRFSNLHGNSFIQVTSMEIEKCFMGLANAGRVAEISSLWSPSASVKLNADGSSPTPILESAAVRGWDRLHRRWIESMGVQKWRYGYVDYDLRDANADLPTMSLSYTSSPTAAYVNFNPSAYPATTDYKRVRGSFSPTVGGAQHSNMMMLKLAFNGPYATAKVFATEGTFEPIAIGSL